VLVACFVGMFVITPDAVVVNVALPAIRTDLGGGMTGLQWIVDGYTLAFAALLLSCGAIADRVGARRAFLISRSVWSPSSCSGRGRSRWSSSSGSRSWPAITGCRS